MTDTIQERLKCEGWCHDPVRQPSCVGHFLDCNACVEFKIRAAHIDAQDAKIKALVEALGRLVKTYSNMEDGDGEPCPDVANAISTLAAAKETTA